MTDFIDILAYGFLGVSVIIIFNGLTLEVDSKLMQLSYAMGYNVRYEAIKKPLVVAFVSIAWILTSEG